MLKLIQTTKQLIRERKQHSKDKSVGLVPTMGNLHQGHLSLVKECLKKNDLSIITIFVNPKQFGPNEDFDSYPRTLEDDLDKLKKVVSEYNKELWVFSPLSIEEIYPAGFATTISLGALTNKLCGLNRPGHFDGVTTVVYRLFALTKPKNAYFGKKDYQQYLIIKRMVIDLDLSIHIDGMPIIRDEDGLALSSRNQYLSDDDKVEALTISKTLREMSRLGSMDELNLELKAKRSEKKWDYLEVLDADNLGPINEQTKKLIALAALKIQGTRLIDNIEFNKPC